MTDRLEINERGLAEIRENLSQHAIHFLGMNPGDIPNEAVYAYAEEAEESENLSYEIRATHSATGSPAVFHISDEGLDVV